MKRDVIILGIHDGHEASAALIKNGKVIAAIAEERLTNVKNQNGTPINAIKKVFEISGIVPPEITAIAIASLIKLKIMLAEEELKLNLWTRFSSLIHGRTVANVMTKILHRFRDMSELKNIFINLGIEDKEIIFVEHHLAHAACAYYQRPWDDETLVLTLDGAGDFLSATVSTGNKFNLDRIASTLSYDSLSNNLYSEITGYLGLKRWEHEYKVMGMAPYGKAEYCIDTMREIIRINPKKPLEFQNISGAYTTCIQPKLRRIIAEQRFDNISAACQQHFEECLLQWVKNCIKETGINKIGCAGGAFLNVKANKLIREMEEVEDVFFYPACGDGGLSVGAALEAYYKYCEREGIKPVNTSLKDLYQGMEYSNEYIEKILKEKEWIDKAEYMGDIEGEIGEMLAKGKIIARFKGRDEWGPRALGNRSILADPRDLRVIRKINFAIKHRDFWMPFTPSMLEERSSDYLINARPARYMIEAFDTNEKADEIIAAIHPFDRTARPQTVNEWNPDYRKILEKFQEHTGVGGVLNTSFNLHGYPIVGTPEIAIETLEKSGLDGLAIGNWMVRK